MARYYEGFVALPKWRLPKRHTFRTPITVIIPARNEAAFIGECLNSILNNNFPSHLLEIIVIDDHSTDDTPLIVQRIMRQSPVHQIKLLSLAEHLQPNETQSYKKKGIEIAIRQSTGQLIITTDGDCIVSPNWLPLLVSFYEKNHFKFIAAPVNFHQEQSDFERFQSLDFAGMIALTGASIHRKMMNMCNGANLAYEKSAFLEVNGFRGIDDKASGDDMMLMQKIAKKYPNKIGFLKNENATTFTLAKPTWKTFYQQRIRWASKSASYDEWQVTLYLGLVWLFCVSIPLTFLLTIFWGMPLVWLGLTQLTLKVVIDYIYLGMVSRFFHRTDLMKNFLTSSAYHLIYIIVIGLMGNLVKEYEWKGRKVK